MGVHHHGSRRWCLKRAKSRAIFRFFCRVLFFFVMFAWRRAVRSVASIAGRAPRRTARRCVPVFCFCFFFLSLFSFCLPKNRPCTRRHAVRQRRFLSGHCFQQRLPIQAAQGTTRGARPADSAPFCVQVTFRTKIYVSGRATCSWRHFSFLFCGFGFFARFFLFFCVFSRPFSTFNHFL